jgi:hypothetical protein
MERDGETHDLDGLIARAASLAASWGATARRATTLGQERAVLRMFGVTGIDRAGHPLAAEVADRYFGPDPHRLAGGISLPFAIAMAEYDLPAGALAQEIATGNVDLGLEADLLGDPAEVVRARALAGRLAAAAFARVDANRTARRELLSLLGDTPRPRIGISLVAPAIVDALDEAAAAAQAGADLVRVEIPPSRELAEQMARTGEPLEGWHPSPASRGGLEAFDPSGPPTPTGSQRAIAVLRAFLDDAGARRGGYVRLATDAPALAAPEQAVVAGFERVDLVIADPICEIVDGHVDPDRALADHAFAHRLLVRAGTRVLVPAGPLLVAGDLAAGVPSDPATLAGRALALQLLAVALALGDGLPRESVIVGALPEWLGQEPGAPARGMAELALRRALFPGHPLAFVEPADSDDQGMGWQALVGALLPDAGDVDLLLCRREGPMPRRAHAFRAIAEIAAGVASARTTPELAGLAVMHRDRALAAARATLDRLAATGWRSLVDQPLGLPDRRLGADAVAERSSGFDPLDPTAGG